MLRIVFSSLGKGFQSSLRGWRILCLLWVLNLVAAAVIAIPGLLLLRRLLDHSLQVESLFKAFHIGWIANLLQRFPDAPVVLGSIFALVAFLYLVLTTFLNAGILGVFFHRETSASLSHFWQYAARYFFRFFRLFLLSLIVYGLLFFLYAKTIDSWLSWSVEGSLSEKAVAWTTWIKVAGYVGLFCMLQLVFDYAKVILILEQNGKVFRSTYRSFRFVFQQRGKVILLFTFLLVLGALFLGLYHMGSQATESLVWLIVAQQVFLLSRLWLRMLFFGAELQLYRNMVPTGSTLPAPLGPFEEYKPTQASL